MFTVCLQSPFTFTFVCSYRLRAIQTQNVICVYVFVVRCIYVLFVGISNFMVYHIGFAQQLLRPLAVFDFLMPISW